MVETFTGGGRLIFFHKLKVSHGIKIFPVT